MFKEKNCKCTCLAVKKHDIETLARYQGRETLALAGATALKERTQQFKGQKR